MKIEDFFDKDYMVTTTATTVRHFVMLEDEGELWMDADYQRGYVWNEQQRQELLESIFAGMPIRDFAIVHNAVAEDSSRYCEVIDGKQRLTSILMFVNDKFSYYNSKTGKSYKFSELSMPIQRTFMGCRLSASEIKPLYGKKVTRQQKLDYFYRTNFAGTPQSNEHMKKVIVLIEAEAAQSALDC